MTTAAALVALWLAFGFARDRSGRWLVAVAYNLFCAASQALNVILYGDPDESISGRLGKAQRGDFGRAWAVAMTAPRVLIDCLNWPVGGWGHCRRAIEDDEGRDGAFRRRTFS
jgi:hypothetical protein